KHDLDVEEDEEHRGEIEADGKALLRHRAGRDAGFEGNRPRAHPPLRPRRESEARHDHRGRDDQSEKPIDRKREPVVEQPYFLSTSGSWRTLPKGPWRASRIASMGRLREMATI